MLRSTVTAVSVMSLNWAADVMYQQPTLPWQLLSVLIIVPKTLAIKSCGVWWRLMAL